MFEGLVRALIAFGNAYHILLLSFGFVCVGVAMYKAAQLGRRDGAAVRPVTALSFLLLGVACINIGLFIRTMSVSMAFQTSVAEGILTCGSPTCFDQVEGGGGLAGTTYQEGVNFSIAVIQTVGLLALGKGLMLFHKASNGVQGVSVGAGLTHLVGGTLALNIKLFLLAIAATMGGAARGAIYKLLGME